MALPKRIRVNVRAPFPAQVSGSGFILVNKASGIWTISHDYTKLAAFVGTVIPANMQFAVRDAGTGAYDLVTLAALSQAAQIRTQRSVTVAGDFPIQATDSILNVNTTAAALACTLPQASTRAGRSLTFKDVGGSFLTHNLTITPFAGDTIDGAASFVMSLNRQSVTLVPFNDAVNTGWAIE